MVNQVKARHILVAKEADARKIMAEINDEAGFANMARKFSTCPSGKRAGGDLGFFGRDMMAKEFENAAFSASLNTVVGPVKTQFGYHLIMVTANK